jgi:hypothetical protein
MKQTLGVLCLLVASTPALAWNGTGHMVVARLAWRQLTEEQQTKVIAILNKHPHWTDYLAAGHRDGVTEDEWAFMRTATWADGVRGRRDFDQMGKAGIRLVGQAKDAPARPAWAYYR